MPGGRTLKRLNLEADILAAARVDRFSVVPELNVQRWRIGPLAGTGAGW
jgi:hypothetical protein